VGLKIVCFAGKIMAFDEETNKFIDRLLLVGSLVTTIICIALNICITRNLHYIIDPETELITVLLIGGTGLFSIVLMYISANNLTKVMEKQNE